MRSRPVRHDTGRLFAVVGVAALSLAGCGRSQTASDQPQTVAPVTSAHQTASPTLDDAQMARLPAGYRLSGPQPDDPALRCRRLHDVQQIACLSQAGNKYAAHPAP